jgi:excisionase family DNA binding protein
MEKLLKAEQVAMVLNISRSKAYKLMRQKEIPTITIGKNVRVCNEDLEKYVLKNRNYNGGNNG